MAKTKYPKAKKAVAKKYTKKTTPKPKAPMKRKRNYQPAVSSILADSMSDTYTMTVTQQVTKQDYMRYLLSTNTLLINDNLTEAEYRELLAEPPVEEQEDYTDTMPPAGSLREASSDEAEPVEL